MQMKCFLKAPACEQLGFLVMAAYVRDARPLGYTIFLGLHWSELRLIHCLVHVVLQGLLLFGWSMLELWQWIASACLKHWLPFSGKQTEWEIAGVFFPERWWQRGVSSDQSARLRGERRGKPSIKFMCIIVSSFMHIVDTIIVLACFRQLQVTIRPNTDMSGFALGKALEMAAQFIDGRLQPPILQQPRHSWKCHGPKPLNSIQKIGTASSSSLQGHRRHCLRFL